MWIWVHSSVLSSMFHLCLPLPDSGNGMWNRLREYPVQSSWSAIPIPQRCVLKPPEGSACGGGCLRAIQKFIEPHIVQGFEEGSLGRRWLHLHSGNLSSKQEELEWNSMVK